MPTIFDQEPKGSDNSVKPAQEAKRIIIQAYAGGTISLVREHRDLRPHLSVAGEVSFDQLFQTGIPAVAGDKREQIKLQEILLRAAITIAGLRTFGGGISRVGELLKPQDMEVKPGEVYVPNLENLELNVPLQAELSRRQLMFNYRERWIERWGFDHQPYLTPGTKVAMSLLVAPGMDEHKFNEAEKELGKENKGYFPTITLQDEALKKHIVRLYGMYSLPMVIGSRTIYKAILCSLEHHHLIEELAQPTLRRTVDISSLLPEVSQVETDRQPMDYSPRGLAARMQTPNWQDAYQSRAPYRQAIQRLSAGTTSEVVPVEGEDLSMIIRSLARAAGDIGQRVKISRTDHGSVFISLE